VLDLSQFSWGRIEAPMGIGCGERVSPPHWREVPLPIIFFLVFDLQMVNFGVF